MKDMSQKKPAKSAREYIDDLASRGRYQFTVEDFANARESTVVAARAALRRLGERGTIAMPYRGFLVIVPPEYRALGCLPPEQFIPQLMDYLNEPYYVGLLSAARYYGAAHQAPQTFQIMTKRNRKPITCGKIRVDFVAKNSGVNTLTTPFNTQRGVIMVSTPEATALDLVGYQQHCGGLEHVATVLGELSEKLSSQKLADAAALVPIPWVQRLGYLLHLVGAKAKATSLQKMIERQNPPITPLQPGIPVRGSEKDRDFRVALNSDVEPDK